MPHIIVKLFPGRTEEQKQLCAEGLVQTLKNTINADEKSISIEFEEVPREMWKEKVYLPEIIGKSDKLAKKPGYTMD
ncbi:MAG: tautomerase family protein [Acetivibrionales bacterium]|jgi:4-oxalocrotonate tautomerase